MKKQMINLAIPILLLSIGILQISAQKVDKNIEEIRQVYKQTNATIAEAEKDFSVSEIFLTELIVNKGGTSYPAVGNFKQTVKFYYTYGDRELDPYPNRLLKIIVSTERAAHEEYAEFVFDQTEKLIFYFGKNDGLENRLYFASGKVIRYQKEQEVLPLNNAEAKELLKEVTSQKNSLMQIFRNSLN
jgi:hypothetical protein